MVITLGQNPSFLQFNEVFCPQVELKQAPIFRVSSLVGLMSSGYTQTLKFSLSGLIVTQLSE